MCITCIIAYLLLHTSVHHCRLYNPSLHYSVVVWRYNHGYHLGITWVSHEYHIGITCISHGYHTCIAYLLLHTSVHHCRPYNPTLHLQHCIMEIQSPLAQAYSPSRQPVCVIKNAFRYWQRKSSDSVVLYYFQY